MQPQDAGRLVLAMLGLLQSPPAHRFTAATFDPIVREGIERGAYPGAALAIGGADSIDFLKGYGRLTWNAASPAVDPERTLYDLASVTKVVATTTALMLLVDRGKVRLDDRVVTYVPEFHGPGTDSITVRQLLAHTSGLRADLPDTAIRAAPDAAALLHRVYAETPRAAPGSRVDSIHRYRWDAGETRRSDHHRDVL